MIIFLTFVVVVLADRLGEEQGFRAHPTVIEHPQQPYQVLFDEP
jgi:hypothetical protein